MIPSAHRATNGMEIRTSMGMLACVIALTKCAMYLEQLLSSVRPGLQEEWRQLALHWSTHARDPDLSLASLRAFAALGTSCDAALLRNLTLLLWGALRDGAVRSWLRIQFDRKRPCHVS